VAKRFAFRPQGVSWRVLDTDLKLPGPVPAGVGAFGLRGRSSGGIVPPLVSALAVVAVFLIALPLGPSFGFSREPTRWGTELSDRTVPVVGGGLLPTGDSCQSRIVDPSSLCPYTASGHRVSGAPNVNPGSGPSARRWASIAYDAADGYTVLYGGVTSGCYCAFANDTWKLANGVWTNITGSRSPPHLEGAAMTYDPIDGYVVLFGGGYGGGIYNQTWTFLAGNWTRLLPALSPPARAYGLMTFDSKDGYMVLFGGSVARNDTWKFIGGIWTNITAGVAPAGRVMGAIAYQGNATAGQVILSEGYGVASGTFVFPSDTWEFAGGNWSLVANSATPSGLYGSAAAYDPVSAMVVMFGGTNQTWLYQNATWGYRGGSWSQLSTGRSPPGRMDAAMTYDAALQAVVCFGGVNGTQNLADTWLYKSGTWSTLPPPSYMITFHESGLPNGTTWSVSMAASVNHSSGATIGFSEPDGNYSFVVGGIAGYAPAPASGVLTVSGKAVDQAVVFSPRAQPTYSVVFTAIGLPLGTRWSVNLNGTTNTSSSSTISFEETNGTYSYSVGPAAGYSVSPTSGLASVDGHPVSIDLIWTRQTFIVAFAENGLPSGTTWSIDLNGTWRSSAAGTISFREPDGTYPYTVGSVSGYQPNQTAGSIPVNGANRAVSVMFILFNLPRTNYLVTFTEPGLTPGTSWTVTLNGTTVSVTAVTVEFTEANGSYPFSIGVASAFTASPTVGTISINGYPVSQAIRFTSNSPSVFLGLPTITGYAVLGGIAAILLIGVVVAVERSRRRGRSPEPAPARPLSGEGRPPSPPE
jgi:hypothetical protein